MRPSSFFFVSCLALLTATLGLALPALAHDPLPETLGGWQAPFETTRTVSGLALDTRGPDGGPLTLELREAPAEDYGVLHSRVFVGEVYGDPGSLVILTRHRDAEAVAGMVFASKWGQLSMRSAGRTLDVERLAPPAPMPKLLERMHSLVPKSLEETQATVVDVMVLYTQRALDAVAGGTVGMQAAIDLQVAYMNGAFTLSDVDFLSLRLLFTGLVDYDEGSSSANRSDVLKALRLPSDGQMDEVHAWRDYFGADVVNLQATVNAGVSYTSDTFNPAFAFSVVPPGPHAASTFAHEVGHNFNCRHDYLDYSSNPTTSNHAWTSCYPDYEDCVKGCQDSYFCLFYCRQGFDACVPSWSTLLGVSGVASHLRIPYFSNPNVDYFSEATGQAQRANNAGNLKVAGPQVADHRTYGSLALEVQMNPPGGSFSQSVDVGLAVSAPTIAPPQIYYTLNGSEPTTESMYYTGPFNLAASATVKAIAYFGAQPITTVAVESFVVASVPEECDGLDNDGNGIIDDGDACDCTYSAYGNKVYRFCSEEVTWAIARAACQAEGQDLVIINDSAENAWVASTGASDNRWLGITDAVVDGTWLTVEGAAAPYFGWSSGEPNGDENENCALMWFPGGGWNDLRCYWTNAFVCE